MNFDHVSDNRVLIYPYPTGPCRGFVHVVEKGDTLYKIGKTHHVSVANLILANPFVDIYNLQIGTELCVPAVKMPRENGPQTANDNAVLGGTFDSGISARDRSEMMDRMMQDDRWNNQMSNNEMMNGNASNDRWNGQMPVDTGMENGRRMNENTENNRWNNQLPNNEMMNGNASNDRWNGQMPNDGVSDGSTGNNRWNNQLPVDTGMDNGTTMNGDSENSEEVNTNIPNMQRTIASQPVSSPRTWQQITENGRMIEQN